MYDLGTHGYNDGGGGLCPVQYTNISISRAHDIDSLGTSFIILVYHPCMESSRCLQLHPIAYMYHIVYKYQNPNPAWILILIE